LWNSTTRRLVIGAVTTTIAVSLLAAGSATAATVTFKTAFSNGALGDGTTATYQFAFAGNEYSGGPQPLASIALHLPAGIGGSRATFPLCERSTLELTGAQGCPPGSGAGPPGTIAGLVTFGSERVTESGTVQAFFGPGEAIYFYVIGTSPVSLEFIMAATPAPDSAPFGSILNISVPSVMTVPGAPLVAFSSLTLALGASRSERGTQVNSLTIPTECPAGGFAWEADVGFVEGTGLEATYKSPCPTGRPTSPLLGQREGVAVTAGEVAVRVKGSSSFTPLTATQAIPDGSELDTTNGRAMLAAATTVSGESRTAEIYGGRSIVHQDRTRGETELTLSQPLGGCSPGVQQLPSRALDAARRSRSKSRHLWVSENGGSWGTNGRYVTTTVEGTSWLTQDECKRSVVRVVSGRVAVYDLLARRTRVLSAGQRYVAQRHRRRRR
jgi:hypothetical protein